MSKKNKAPKYTPTNRINIKDDLEKFARENEIAFLSMEAICAEYNEALVEGETLIDDVTDLINSIANRPKKFDEQIGKIKAIKIEHLTIDQYKTEERKALIEGGLLATAIAAVGAMFAVLGESKRSGIIGAIIALIGFIFGGITGWFQKRKAMKQAIEAINKLQADTFSLQQNHAMVQSALHRLQSTAMKLRELLRECEQYRGFDKLSFIPMSESRKKLSLLVTNTASFAKLLSQKV